MTPRAVSNRNAGLALISRINRWLIAGAIGLSGLISLVAAHAFHGRTIASSSSSAANSSQSQTSAGSSSSSSSDDGSALQQPAQAPVPAPAPAAPAPVVSGGS